MVYFKLISLLLVQYTLAAPASKAGLWSEPSDAADKAVDLLELLKIDLKDSSKKAAESCFHYSVGSINCITTQSVALNKKDFQAFLKESRMAAIEVANTGSNLISDVQKRPMLMKLQAKCQKDIEQAKTRMEKVLTSYASEQMNYVASAISELGFSDFSKLGSWFG